MTVASDMIRRAMVLATVIGDDEIPTAQQASDHLADMNEMMAAWRIWGLEMGAPYLLTDTLSVPDNYLRALRFNLAVEFAPSYGVSAANVMVGRRSLADIAADEFALVRASRFEVGDLDFERALLPRLTRAPGFPL